MYFLACSQEDAAAVSLLEEAAGVSRLAPEQAAAVLAQRILPDE